jgi:hypothetical protein
MLLSFEPLYEICIVSWSRIVSIVLHRPCNAILPARAQRLELTLKHWNRRLIQCRSKLFGNVHVTRIAGITSPQEMGEILGKVVHPGLAVKENKVMALIPTVTNSTTRCFSIRLTGWNSKITTRTRNTPFTTLGWNALRTTLFPLCLITVNTIDSRA